MLFNHKIQSLKDYYIISQALLLIGMIICFIIQPHGLIADEGISYYGGRIVTVVPYAIGIVGATSIANFGTKKYKITKDFKNYSKLIWLILLLSIGVVLAPYNYDTWLTRLHEIFGASIFLIQLFMAIKILKLYKDNKLNYYLFAVQLFGGLMSAIYFFPKNGYLIEAQLLFQFAFGLILINSAHQLARQ